MDIEGSMRCRLRMSEVIPFEMSQYRIGEFRPWWPRSAHLTPRVN